MSAQNYKTIIGDQRIAHWEEQLSTEVWPMFMRQDKTVKKYWPNVYKAFRNFQFAFMSGDQLMGVGNSIPLFWDKPFTELPDRGQDWAIEKANQDWQQGILPNVLVGLQILIPKAQHGQGLSYRLLGIMKSIAANNNLTHIALPVRPTLKSNFPKMDMEDYCLKTNDAGWPEDPWIRVHAKAGGKIIRVCSQSMQITGSITEWEHWTKMKMRQSGEYLIKEALTPVRVDEIKGIGTYAEPNIWILHDAQEL